MGSYHMNGYALTSAPVGGNSECDTNSSIAYSQNTTAPIVPAKSSTEGGEKQAAEETQLRLVEAQMPEVIVTDHPALIATDPRSSPKSDCPGDCPERDVLHTTEAADLV